MASPETGISHCCYLIIFLMGTSFSEPQMMLITKHHRVTSFRSFPSSSGSLSLAISVDFKRCWGFSISDQIMKNTYIKPLVKYAAMLICYFWCKHISNFLVAQQKEHLWFLSPVVLSSQCGEKQGALGVCCVLEGVEHHQRGAKRFILRAVTRQC